MSALDFDIKPPPLPEAPTTQCEPTLEGTQPPPPLRSAEAEPPLEVSIEDADETRFEEDELEELELPDLPQKKEKIKDDDVFSPPKVAPVKKPRKKRKPMTPEQLERLAEGRKKAFAVRAQKKKERDEMKALEKKVAQKKKEKMEQDIIDTLDEDEIPETMKRPKKVSPPPSAPSVPTLTQEDLRKAIAEGVEIYDTKRKAQKKVKREKQEVEARQKEVRQKVQRAISVNPWDEFLK